MPDSVSSAPVRGNTVKRVGIALASLLVALILLYLVAASSWFLKAVVLPRVSQSIHATVTVEDISLSPFSSVSIRGLKVATLGGVPLAAVKDLRIRYSLLDILRGTLTIHELLVEGAAVQIVPIGGGRDSLSPILEVVSGPSSSGGGPEAAPGKPLRLQVRNVAIKGLEFRQTSLTSTGSSRVMELVNGSVSLDHLAQGQSGKWLLAGDLKLEQAGVGALVSRLQSEGNVTLGLSAVPESATGTLRVEVAQASGAYATAAGLSLEMQGALTATECRQLALRLQREGRTLSSVTVSGPLDLAKREARLKLGVEGIGRELLSILTAGTPLDLNDTAMAAHAELEVSQGGNGLALTGQVGVLPLSVTRDGVKTPSVTVSMTWALTANLLSKTAVLRGFELKADQGAKNLVNGAITAPLSIAWGGASLASGDAALEIQVTGVELAEWKALAGSLGKAGRLQSRFKLSSSSDGKDLVFEKQVEIADLVTGAASLPMSVKSSMKGHVSELARVAVDDWNLVVLRSGNPALTLQAAAGFDRAGGDFSFKTSLSLIPSLLKEGASSVPLPLTLAGEGRWTPASVLELKRIELLLADSSRATPNRLAAQGSLNCAQPQALEGILHLQSSSLDLTGLYEAFGSSANVAVSETNVAASFPREESAASVLPVKSFTADLRVTRLHLGEVRADDLQADVSVTGGRVRLQPLKMSIGGAPFSLSADVDLGIPGSKYDVSWQADRLPVEPFANTFTPAMKGQVHGEFSSRAAVKGLGITGKAVRTSLVGDLGFSLTNAAIQIPAGSSKVWIFPVDLNRIAGTLGLGDLTQSPITLMGFSATAARGRIVLNEALVQSDAFKVTASGGIELADLLEDSGVAVPLEVYLSPSLYQRLRPLAAESSAPYSKLPSFVSLGGTLAKVETKLDKGKLIGLTVGAALGLAGNSATNLVGKGISTVGKAVDGLGSLFGVGKSGTNRPAATNASPGVNPFKDLFKKKP